MGGSKRDVVLKWWFRHAAGLGAGA